MMIAFIVCGVAIGVIAGVIIDYLFYDDLADYCQQRRKQGKIKKDKYYRIDCYYLSKEYIIDKSFLKCAVNPKGDCHCCPHYYKEEINDDGYPW